MNKKVFVVIGMLVSAGVGAASAKLWLSPTASEVDPADTATAQDPLHPAGLDDGTPVTVSLTDRKMAAVAPRSEPVSEHLIQAFNTVPGRLRYDDLRHIEVRIATSGVLTSVKVKPGDQVAAGDILAELNSSEVGHARADVLQRESDLALVTQRRDWEQLVCRGLLQLAAAIQERRPLETIREQFKGVSIGAAREKILTNYSQLLLAESLTKSAIRNTASGVIPANVLQERQSDRDSAEAALQGTLEQLLFEARQTCRQAELSVEDAERRLKISKQNVATLLGISGNETISLDGMEVAQDTLSLVRVRAPFAATVEQKNFSASERVDVGESLFVLADTSSLWVSADLRDRDRAALSLKPGDPVEVFVTPGATSSVNATVNFVGREVDPMTNAVPLVAVIQNTDGNLRPGMYVTVKVPLGTPQQAVAVPESAIVEHDSQTFVFVPESGNTFRRVDVVTGQKTGEFVEIISGLSAGDQVVVNGAFVLKSELLLEREE